MKKLIVFVLMLSFLLYLAGCHTSHTDESGTYFIGKVIEVYREGYLLAVTNTGSHYFAIGEMVAVDIDNGKWSYFSVGDHIRVEFDNERPTGNPPLIESKYVYSIKKTDENGNIIK